MRRGLVHPQSEVRIGAKEHHFFVSDLFLLAAIYLKGCRTNRLISESKLCGRISDKDKISDIGQNPEAQPPFFRSLVRANGEPPSRDKTALNNQFPPPCLSKINMRK